MHQHRQYQPMPTYQSDCQLFFLFSFQLYSATAISAPSSYTRNAATICSERGRLVGSHGWITLFADFVCDVHSHDELDVYLVNGSGGFHSNESWCMAMLTTACDKEDTHMIFILLFALIFIKYVHIFHEHRWAKLLSISISLVPFAPRIFHDRVRTIYWKFSIKTYAKKNSNEKN